MQITVNILLKTLEVCKWSRLSFLKNAHRPIGNMLRLTHTDTNGVGNSAKKAIHLYMFRNA